MKKHNMLLVLPLIALLAGCGPDTSSSNTSSTTPTPTTPTSTTTPTPAPTPTIEISGEVTKVYITKQITFTAETKNTTDSVVWESSDATKATVEGGVVTALAPGEVTITASLSKEATIKDEVKITVLDTVIDSSVNASAWDFTSIYQDEATIKPVHNDVTNDIKTYATFKNAKGKQYVAKAHFDTKAVGDWTWNTMTIGHIDGDGYIYATGFSQKSTKLITQISKTAGGVEQQWGAMSNRSQVWGQHDLGSLDTSNGVDIMSVRNNGDFYFFINEELYWKETSGFNDFDDKDTEPVIYLNGVEAEMSKLSVTTDAAEVKKVVDSVSEKRFYPTYAANVEINEDQTQIKFKNADNITTNNKDVAAKSIGDANILPANKESKVEFDLVIDTWGSTDSAPAVCMDMLRWDENVPETRTFLITETGVSFAGWNYNSDMPGNYPAGKTAYNNGTSDIKMSEGKTYHVICTRLMLDGGQDTKIEVKDGDTTIATMQHGWQDGYKGNAFFHLSVRNVNATLSNINVTSAE